jgi:hypothetical protein
MSDSLFEEGGPHRIRRTGHEQYEMSVSLPVDEDGMLGRECPAEDCSPAYFKLRSGTGITGGQTIAYCPYCRRAAEPSAFHTREQIRFAQDLAKQEAMKGVDRMVRDAFGLGSSSQKRLVDGLISVDVQYKPGYRPPVRQPAEAELRRDLSCPHCGLEHAVFGLATWCPDCGKDVFVLHVEAEFAVLAKIIEEVPVRRDRLGHRVAARDLDNALEDVVSIFEAVLKFITRRHLQSLGRSPDEVEALMRGTVRNTYQNVGSAEKTYRDSLGAELLATVSEEQKAQLSAIFEKRHPITHNLGVVDRRYLDRARSGELEGREVRVTGAEVGSAIEIALLVLRSAYGGRFPTTGP